VEGKRGLIYFLSHLSPVECKIYSLMADILNVSFSCILLLVSVSLYSVSRGIFKEVSGMYDFPGHNFWHIMICVSSRTPVFDTPDTFSFGRFAMITSPSHHPELDQRR
jgi:hypothetical protein